MRIGNAVMSPLGKGQIINIERSYNHKRFIVRLEDPSKFVFQEKPMDPAFWPEELTIISKSEINSLFT